MWNISNEKKTQQPGWWHNKKGRTNMTRSNRRQPLNHRVPNWNRHIHNVKGLHIIVNAQRYLNRDRGATQNTRTHCKTKLVRKFKWLISNNDFCCKKILMIFSFRTAFFCGCKLTSSSINNTIEMSGMPVISYTLIFIYFFLPNLNWNDKEIVNTIKLKKNLTLHLSKNEISLPLISRLGLKILLRVLWRPRN